jgi:transposase
LSPLHFGWDPKARKNPNGFFMAMMSTIQSNAKFKREYQALVAKGKPKKVAIVACMRKMITILNTMVKKGEIWNEKLA